MGDRGRGALAVAIQSLLTSTLVGAMMLAVARPTAHADDVLARGVAALVALQADDGAWRSALYAPLRAGPGLTAFIADTLVALPEAVRAPHATAIRRALDWLAREAGEEREPFATTGSRYPTYAAAFALSAFARGGTHEKARARLQQWLCAAQLSEGSGWTLDDRGYGGWDAGAPRPRPIATHANISVFASVIVALDRAGLPGDHPLRRRAAVFLTRCRGLDGGYGFSWHDPVSSKAGWYPERAGLADYGSATADGLLAMRALGVGAESAGGRAAFTRFAERFGVDAVWGFAASRGQELAHADERPWSTALRLYGLARAAEAFALVAATPDDKRRAIAEALAAEQDRHGLWRGKGSLMMEDDPVLGTALALRALGACAG